MPESADSRLSAAAPDPLPWPRVRELGADGEGRRLLGRVLRRRGGDRTAAARDLAFRLLGGVTPSVAVERDGIRFHLNTADKEISRIVFIYGVYDKPLMDLAFAALGRLGGPPSLDGRLFLDIGANIGTSTLTAHAYFGAGGGFAFEPEPENARFLAANLAANHLDGQVRVVRAAVSRAEGTLELERSDWNAGDHRVAAARAGRGMTIEAVAIDDLIAAGELDPERVGLAWVDVQGHEGHALAGAGSLLAAGVPVVLEYWPAGLRRAGGLDLLNEVIGEHYDRFVDLGGPEGTTDLLPRPVAELGDVAARYSDEDAHSDLLLVPPALA